MPPQDPMFTKEELEALMDAGELTIDLLQRLHPEERKIVSARVQPPTPHTVSGDLIEGGLTTLGGAAGGAILGAAGKGLSTAAKAMPAINAGTAVQKTLPWIGGLVGTALKHPIAGWAGGSRLAKYLASRTPKAASNVKRITGPMADRPSVMAEVNERVHPAFGRAGYGQGIQTDFKGAVTFNPRPYPPNVSKVPPSKTGFVEQVGQVSKGVQNDFRGRVSVRPSSSPNPLPNGAPKRPQARPGGTQQAASNDSAKVPPRRPSGPAPKLPAGNNADYQGWVDKVNSRAPLTTDIEKLLAELRKSLTKDAKRVPGKRPTQRKPK